MGNAVARRVGRLRTRRRPAARDFGGSAGEARPAFPFGTLAVNLLGSFALGFFFGLRNRTLLLGPDLWLFLGTGLCGGFTTMSTFSLETLALMRQREAAYAALNLALTVCGCLAATAAGYLSLRLLPGGPR